MPAADVTRLLDHHTIGRCATPPKCIRTAPRTFVVLYNTAFRYTSPVFPLRCSRFFSI